MIIPNPNAVCEFCGSKDLRLEVAIIWKWPVNDSAERIKCCNCGRILLKDYEENDNERDSCISK